MSAIHDAAANGDVARVKSLIDASAMVVEEVDPYDHQKRRPLHIAAGNGQVAVIDLLLKNNADINATAVLGTPLHYAALSGKTQAIEFLINHGANVNAEDLDGRTPLKNAQESGHRDAITLLQSKGAIAKSRGCMGVLLLMACISTAILVSAYHLFI